MVKKSLRICLAVSTDGQTGRRMDRQTDILPQHSLRCAYTLSGKNDEDETIKTKAATRIEIKQILYKQ